MGRREEGTWKDGGNEELSGGWGKVKEKEFVRGNVILRGEKRRAVA